jgi:hypothetical protein
VQPDWNAAARGPPYCVVRPLERYVERSVRGTTYGGAGLGQISGDPVEPSSGMIDAMTDDMNDVVREFLA